MLPKKTIDHIQKLQQKKYRKEFAEFTVEGVKGVLEALQNDAEVLLVLLQDNMRDDDWFIQITKLCEEQEVPIEMVGRKDVGDIKTTETFPGVMAIVGCVDYGPDAVFDGGTVIALDSIKDPGNLGTIIRTADWFGIQNILLSEDSVEPYNPKVVRSTMGSIFRVKIYETNHIATTLLKAKDAYRLVGFSMDGKNIHQFETGEKPSIYLFGSESHGLRADLEKLLDERYTIPGIGGAESLNVAVAAGIVMSKL